MTALRAQGVPSCVGVIQGLEELPVKTFGEAKKAATDVLHHELGEDIKIAEAHNKVQLMRALTTTNPNSIQWRRIRSYLLAYHVEVDTAVDESGCAMAKVRLLLGDIWSPFRPLTVGVHTMVTRCTDFFADALSTSISCCICLILGPFR